MWYVALDIHAETTVISVRSARGVVVKRKVVPTTASSLRRALSPMRGKVRVACEVGPMAAWVRRCLQTELREVVICDRRRTRLVIPGGSKTDRIDADRLSECLRLGAIHAVHVPNGQHLQLRRLAWHYLRMLNERRRVVQRLRALFLESGVRVPSPRSDPRRVPMRRLPDQASKSIARAYIRQIELTTVLVDEAKNYFLTAARQLAAHELLQTVPHVGEIRAAMLLAIIGNPERFRSRRAVWAYAGLAVVQKVSAEHRVKDGRVIKETRRSGVHLSRAAQPVFKKLLRDMALHASIRGGPFRKVYDAHLKAGRRPSIARLSLARKIAAVIFAVWRSGKGFDERMMRKRKRKQTSGRASAQMLSHRRASVDKATALTICRPEILI